MDWDPFSRRPRSIRRVPVRPVQPARRQPEEPQGPPRPGEGGGQGGSPPGAGRPAEASQAPAGQAAASAVSQAVIAEFEKELAAARRERDEWQDRYEQTLAETQTMRQRLQRNAEERAFEENRTVLRRFLEVADNLERALAAAEGADATGPLAEGVRLTYRELQRALADAGVTLLETVGQPFDPSYHEAVATLPSTGTAPGTVIEETKKGYTFQDRLLRPAQVIVSA